MASVLVMVRDGRVDRDPSKVTVRGGELLMVLKLDQPLKLGARLHLPDGTEVEVIGIQSVEADESEQHVIIGHVTS
jgi:hypothetical protein